MQEKEGEVNAYELLHRIDLSNQERTRALEALEASTPQCINVHKVLSEEKCSTLRDFVCNQMVVDNNNAMDDVDGCPDFQVNLSETKLRALIGHDAVDRLYRLPKQLDVDGAPQRFERVGMFLRMYEPHTRPWMQFHVDANRYTVNVALNSDDEFEGGRLMGVFDHKVQRIGRAEGDATCHAGSVAHAVSSMISGTRYSLILFFHAEDQP